MNRGLLPFNSGLYQGRGIGCKVRNSTSQSLANPGAILTWDTVLYDSSGGGMFNPKGGTPTRLTIVFPGTYLIMSQLHYTPFSTNQRNMDIWLNRGMSNQSYLANTTLQTTTANDPGYQISAIAFDLKQSDYIEINGGNNAGTTVSTNATYTWLSVYRLGD